jgi:hypothetical protein
MEDRKSIPVPPGNTRGDAVLERRLELLELSRKRLLYEIEAASGDRLREMKRRALRHIEAEIAAGTAPHDQERTAR